jgi:hypothetical protein
MNGYRFHLVFKVKVQTGKPPCKNWTPINIDFNLARDWNNLTFLLRKLFTIVPLNEYIYREMVKNPEML